MRIDTRIMRCFALGSAGVATASSAFVVNMTVEAPAIAAAYCNGTNTPAVTPSSTAWGRERVQVNATCDGLKDYWGWYEDTKQDQCDVSLEFQGWNGQPWTMPPGGATFLGTPKRSWGFGYDSDSSVDFHLLKLCGYNPIVSTQNYKNWGF